MTEKEIKMFRKVASIRADIAYALLDGTLKRGEKYYITNEISFQDLKNHNLIISRYDGYRVEFDVEFLHNDYEMKCFCVEVI